MTAIALKIKSNENPFNLKKFAIWVQPQQCKILKESFSKDAPHITADSYDLVRGENFSKQKVNLCAYQIFKDTALLEKLDIHLLLQELKKARDVNGPVEDLLDATLALLKEKKLRQVISGEEDELLEHLSSLAKSRKKPDLDLKAWLSQADVNENFNPRDIGTLFNEWSPTLSIIENRESLRTLILLALDRKHFKVALTALKRLGQLDDNGSEEFFYFAELCLRRIGAQLNSALEQNKAATIADKAQAQREQLKRERLNPTAAPILRPVGPKPAPEVAPLTLKELKTRRGIGLGLWGLGAGALGGGLALAAHASNTRDSMSLNADRRDIAVTWLVLGGSALLIFGLTLFGKNQHLIQKNKKTKAQAKATPTGLLVRF